MNIRTNPFLMADFYKVSHPFQYPPNTQFVYSNFTPRSSRLPGVSHMVLFGLQYFIKRYLMEYFEENFFGVQLGETMDKYRRRIKTALGADLPSVEHIEYIHALGFLPLHIKALPEGSSVPMRVPCITLVNTDPKAYWLTNFIETWMSCSIWQASTSATIAHEYRKLLNGHAAKTGMAPEFVQWQGHDFSFRGMSSVESAVLSGMGHLLSFTGTDTIPAIDGLEQYYGANADNELIGGSVPATEHSVMCAGGSTNERETFLRLITEVYPAGIVSIVSDTWDLWKVLTELLPSLSDVIMARDGKVVIRPDSGDPVKILIGDPDSLDLNARAGVVELLWNHFGGTFTETGHKLLDSHVGCIYGDSINLARADAICSGLEQKGFASQCVFGIGSYTYQYNTRDTFGTAMKATHVVIDGKAQNIFKSPATDDGMKKSATGLLMVDKVDDEFVLHEGVDRNFERHGQLKTVFLDGKLTRDQSLSDIRERLVQTDK